MNIAALTIDPWECEPLRRPKLQEQKCGRDSQKFNDDAKAVEEDLLSLNAILEKH